MTDQALTPADAALRQRVTALSVHILCGGIRGPIRRGTSVLWQSCHHEDSPAQWVGADVSRDHDLCIICFRATAGGRSRWSWKACDKCRDVNRAVGTPFALGRHSLMKFRRPRVSGSNSSAESPSSAEATGGSGRGAITNTGSWQPDSIRTRMFRFGTGSRPGHPAGAPRVTRSLSCWVRASRSPAVTVQVRSGGTARPAGPDRGAPGSRPRRAGVPSCAGTSRVGVRARRPVGAPAKGRGW